MSPSLWTHFHRCFLNFYLYYTFLVILHNALNHIHTLSPNFRCSFLFITPQVHWSKAISHGATLLQKTDSPFVNTHNC